ncbi:flagellar hook-associated protein FlgL [Sedimentibacter sp. zth1]|uniref:flagellar hook-associated protein FlgL n=1 Tax=Sedimentibacter sp. zth1 TaxID=2816908 RepID=UPI001A90D231|nr:flagellar hook-associated protein FlgL [Sedimentibacter sp. zth1]QSX06026.1 flagellar hook-associated protein FlgL [Sedimentibacter sp. zth1]
MRVTNKMITSRYSRDLNKSLSDLNTLSQKVETGRKFQTGAEDPIGAVKAYRLRREYYKNKNYDTNLKEADSTLTSAEGNLMQLNKNLQAIHTSCLKGINGTMTLDEREIISNELKNIQHSIVTTLNSEFNDKYLFSGNSMSTPPFSVSNDNHLLYKGVDVSIADQNATAGSDEKKAYDALVELSKENVYLDIGLSLKVNPDSSIDKNSVFDIGIPGINILGFGKDSTTGISKNVYDTITSICDELEDSNFSMNSISPYLDTFNDQKNDILKEITSIGSKSQYIDFLKSRTENNNINLNSKMFEVECVDPAEAIMDWKMQEYSYNAALQMGMKVIQPSFLDFMR